MIPPFSPAVDVVGRYTGTGNDGPAGARYREGLERLFSDGSDSAGLYDRAVHAEHPGGVTAHGRDAAAGWWERLRRAFPDATFTVHHQIGRDDPGLGERGALRWSLDGVHDGDGMFGPATGAAVHVMGLSHAEFGPWGLRREYVLIDETAIWKQILLATG